ncbi:hypothetical protein GCM10023093_24860 [Nemorincola caseinilytica]|uniref:DUF1835 domain-containing protein n=1 Tax=Nemorincola caseinilytica TaxID=2054315 RepID=A0ABP8NMD2_9BACT
MIYHIVIGDMAAAPLAEAMTTTPELEGEIVVIRDLLNLGPIQKTEDGQKFSDLRSAFWQQVVVSDKSPIQVDDTERLLQVSAAMAANEDIKAWVWIAPWPADICTLLWTTKYLGKYPGRFFVVNIAGLPFLDENGKVFYPKNISELRPKEIVKAKRLARQVSYAEIETDGEEWRKLVNENGAIRTLEGAKRIASRPAEHYDTLLFGFCTQQFQKASKVVNQAMAKHNIPTGDLYLGWRLREMAATDRLRIQGDTTKGLKDFDVKIPSGELDFVTEGVQPVEGNG